MLPVPSRLPGSVSGAGVTRRLGYVLLTLCLIGWQAPLARVEPPATGQLPPPAPVPVQLLPPTCPPCPAPLPPAPEKGPRPPSGPESVRSFLDSISSNDAAFEVIVGQGRILTLKENLAAAILIR